MFDHSDDTTVRRPRRVEVITGPERRRDWPDAEKIAIVAQALEPGVNVSEIIEAHALHDLAGLVGNDVDRAEMVTVQVVRHRRGGGRRHDRDVVDGVLDFRRTARRHDDLHRYLLGAISGDRASMLPSSINQRFLAKSAL